MSEQVEVISRFEKGKETVYSIDGGETWIDKEKLGTHAGGLTLDDLRRANSGPLERKHRENDLPISATKNQVHKRRSES